MNIETLRAGDRVRVLKAFADWDQQKIEAGEEFVFSSCEVLDGGWHTLRFEGRSEAQIDAMKRVIYGALSRYPYVTLPA